VSSTRVYVVKSDRMSYCLWVVCELSIIAESLTAVGKQHIFSFVAHSEALGARRASVTKLQEF